MTSLTHSAAWTQLCEAATQYSANPKDEAFRGGLHRAAQVYATSCAPPKVGPSAQTREAHGELIPFGRSKGQPVGQASTSDLQWVAQALRNSIADAGKARWVESNQKLLDVVERELATR